MGGAKGPRIVKKNISEKKEGWVKREVARLGGGVTKVTGNKRKVSESDEDDSKEVGPGVGREVRRKVWKETDKTTEKTSDLENGTSGRSLILRNEWSTDTRIWKNTKKKNEIETSLKWGKIKEENFDLRLGWAGRNLKYGGKDPTTVPSDRGGGKQKENDDGVSQGNSRDN